MVQEVIVRIPTEEYIIISSLQVSKQGKISSIHPPKEVKHSVVYKLPTHSPVSLTDKHVRGNLASSLLVTL